MRRLVGVLVLGLVACSSGDDKTGDGPDPRDGGRRDSGIEAPRDAGPRDAGAERDAGEADPCRIDLALVGPPEISGPFDADDFPPEAGWIDMTIAFRGVFGPSSAPLTRCELDGPGTLTLLGDGQDRTGSDQVSISFTLSDYAGSGLDSRSSGDGLTVSVTHSDLGNFSGDPDTLCQVCVEPAARRGLFRCTRLLDGAAELEIHRGAFACP